MEITFMTIHNLTAEANILFASESIFDILGYEPYQVVGRSSFDYFHPDELPFAKSVHNRGVTLDKAAVLSYARIRAANGEWVTCECVFTIVFNVLVASTSIYRQSASSNQRAVDAPKIQRLFSSTPKDPRYHMLEHLATSFTRAPDIAAVREPRAALILNRFTRTATVLYSTDAVEKVLGISATELTGKSFYECIQGNCLEGAIRCLESAKANDSIAYLRFWYRDPRLQNIEDEREREGSLSSDSEGGGVALGSPMVVDSQTSLNASPEDIPGHIQSRTSSTESGSSGEARVFDSDTTRCSGARSVRVQEQCVASQEPTELEAVISCTSDGLVVILRRAQSEFSLALRETPAPQYTNGFFAAPWAVDATQAVPPYAPEPPGSDLGYDHGSAPAEVRSINPAVPSRSAPDFMSSIREVAAFAWSLTGINGTLATYGRGHPRGEATPALGYPIWAPNTQDGMDEGPRDQTYANNVGRGPDVDDQPNRNICAPYNHDRQEQLLRQQLGYGDGLMGSDAPGSFARSYLSRYIGHSTPGPYMFPIAPTQQEQQQLVGGGWQDHIGQVTRFGPSAVDPGGSHSGATGRDRSMWY